MHEEALLRDLRRKIEELARAEGAERITRVVLWIGALAHVTELTLRRRWADTMRGTAAEGARLVVESSRDVADPRAQGIVLLQIAVAERVADSDATAVEPLDS